MKDKIQIEKCNCDQTIALEKELFEAYALIQELNMGINTSDYKESGGLHYLGDGSAMLYPVGIAKYKNAMGTG